MTFIMVLSEEICFLIYIINTRLLSHLMSGPMNEQAELLTKVDAYCFAAHDVALYLDTHPNDQEMIRLYDSLNGEVKKVTMEYESKFGPLLKNGATGYPWTWNNSPWPWEK